MTNLSVTIGTRCPFGIQMPLHSLWTQKEDESFILPKIFGKGLTQCQLFWCLRMFRFWLLVFILSATSQVLPNFWLSGNWVSRSSFLHLRGRGIAPILHGSCLVFHYDESTTSNSAAISYFDTLDKNQAKERGQLVFIAHVVYLIIEDIDHYGCSLVGFHVGHYCSYCGPHSTPSPNLFIF